MWRSKPITENYGEDECNNDRKESGIENIESVCLFYFFILIFKIFLIKKLFY